MSHETKSIRRTPWMARTALAFTLLQGISALAANTLANGSRLAAGETLTSANGQYRMNVETDGRLAVYRIEPPAPGAGSPSGMATVHSHWDSGSAGPVHGTLTLEMQADNNLVLYDTVGGTERRAAWNSDTCNAGRAGAAVLVLQDNGELTVQSDGECLWNSMRRITSLGGGSSRITLGIPK